MTRATNTPATKTRRKKLLKQTKGYFGSKHKLFKTAKEQLMNALADARAHRKKKASIYRRLWITRLNITCRAMIAENGKEKLTYSRFIRLLALSQIKLDRKQLSEMAINNPQHFEALVKKVQNPW